MKILTHNKVEKHLLESSAIDIDAMVRARMAHMLSDSIVPIIQLEAEDDYRYRTYRSELIAIDGKEWSEIRALLKEAFRLSSNGDPAVSAMIGAAVSQIERAATTDESEKMGIKTY